VAIQMVVLQGRPPAFLPPLPDFKDRRALGFRQVAEEGEHQPVALIDRIGVDAGPPRDARLRAERGDLQALALAIELPAVVRALDAVALDLAASQRTAAVRAGIGQAAGL